MWKRNTNKKSFGREERNTRFDNWTAFFAFLTALLGLAAVGTDDGDSGQSIRHLLSSAAAAPSLARKMKAVLRTLCFLGFLLPPFYSCSLGLVSFLPICSLILGVLNIYHYKHFQGGIVRRVLSTPLRWSYFRKIASIAYFTDQKNNHLILIIKIFQSQIF